MSKREKERERWGESVCVRERNFVCMCVCVRVSECVVDAIEKALQLSLSPRVCVCKREGVSDRERVCVCE